MKRVNVTGAVLAMTVLILLVGTYTFAQFGGPPPPGPGPMRPPGMPPPPPAMEYTKQGVFVLAGGTLIKYKAGTLEEAGRLELAPRPVEQDEWTPPRPPLPGALLATDDRVIVVTRGEYVLVDPATMKVKIRKELPLPPGGPREMQGPPPPDMPQGGPGMGMPRLGPLPPPVLELGGSTLYILRGPQLLAIDIDSGKVLGQNHLPQPKFPPMGR